MRFSSFMLGKAGCAHEGSSEIGIRRSLELKGGGFSAGT
jgi:hypothetical protein